MHIRELKGLNRSVSAEWSGGLLVEERQAMWWSCLPSDVVCAVASESRIVELGVGGKVLCELQVASAPSVICPYPSWNRNETPTGRTSSAMQANNHLGECLSFLSALTKRQVCVNLGICS